MKYESHLTIPSLASRTQALHLFVGGVESRAFFTQLYPCAP